MIDLTKIPFIPSPNHSPRSGAKISYLVIHSEAGTHLGSISWFKNPKSEVSAHYLVSQKGEVVQMVKENLRAWHCYGLNDVSIGIEHEDKGKSDDPKWVTPELWKASVSLAASLCKKYSIPLSNVLLHSDQRIQDIARRLGHPEFIHGDAKNWDIVKYRKDVEALLNG